MNKIAFTFFFLALFSNSYSQDGSLDSSFGSGGKVNYWKSSSAVLFRCGALQNNGQILAAGILSGAGGGGLVIRYNDDGSIDNKFASSGQYVSGYGNVIRIAVSGTDIYVLSASNLIKLDSTGKLINSFGSNGVIPAAAGFLFAEVTVSPSAVYVSGSENNSQTFIVKYTHSGQAVSSFGSGGVVKFKLESNSNWEKSAGIYFSNDTLYGSTNWASKTVSKRDDIGYVYALDSNGSFINSFGTGGKLLILDTLNSYSGISKMSFDELNHFYVGGSSFSNYSFLARINKSSGNLDMGFGNQGVQKLDVESLISLTVQDDGKPIVVSTFRNASNQADFHLVRTDLSGKLDHTFGTAGEVKTSYFDNDFPNYMIYDRKNNKIIVFGHADGTSVRGLVIRYIGNTNVNTNLKKTDLKELILYPNPGTGKLYISGMGSTALTDIKIYDITGQSLKFDSQRVNEEIQIQLNAKAGIYILRAQINGQEITRRFVINVE